MTYLAEGTKVRYTGKAEYDLTPGKIYTVVNDTEGDQKYFGVTDDEGFRGNRFVDYNDKYEVIRDFSDSNPKLHKLYTQNALETLEVLDRAIEEFNSHSRVDSSILCGVLMRERAKLVANDKAYQDAAVIRYIGGQDWLDEVGKED